MAKATTKASETSTAVTPAVTKGPETSVPAPQQDELGALKVRMTAASAEVAACREAIQAILPGDRPVALHEDIYSPANRQRSLTYIPEVLKPPGRALRWGHKTMVDYHRGQGWSPSDWDKMKERADAANRDLRWTKTAEGHIQNGDLVLLETSMARLEELQALKKARNAARDGQAKSTMKAMERQLKERYGEAVAGMDVFEGERGGGISTELNPS